MKICTANSYSFLVIVITHSSDNCLHFRENFLERIKKLIITIDDKIRNEELQYNINKEEAKTTAFSSGKIDQYEFLTGEKILPSDQSRIIEKAKFTYSPLCKAFEKKIRAIEDQEIKTS